MDWTVELNKIYLMEGGMLNTLKQASRPFWLHLQSIAKTSVLLSTPQREEVAQAMIQYEVRRILEPTEVTLT